MARKKLLYFLHNFHNRAGTEEHVKTLASGLKEHFEIAFLYPDGPNAVLRFHDTGEERRFGLAQAPWSIFQREDPGVTEGVMAALAAFAPNLIHIHHLFNWPLNILEVVLDHASHHGAQTVMTFHDYYSATPVFTIQGVNTLSEALSKPYVEQVFQRDITPFLFERANYIGRLLQRVNVLLSPSNFLARTLQTVFPIPIRVLTHGIKLFPQRERISSATVRFGYVGSLLPQKGWRELLSAWNNAFQRGGIDAELHLYGGGETPAALPRGATYHGVYEQADLPLILSSIDIGVIPSVFPETFSLVLSEMQQAALPVIASSYGVFPERMRPGENGWIVNPYDTLNFAKLITEIAQSSSWRTWNIPQPKLSAEMADEYRVLYDTLL